MWPLAPLRLVGLSKEERSRPITGWRRWFFHPVIWLLSRGVFFSLGFLWVKVKGRRADLKEAPVLVVAPHSTFLDMLVLCPTQLPTVVSRSENTSLPVIGGEECSQWDDRMQDLTLLVVIFSHFYPKRLPSEEHVHTTSTLGPNDTLRCGLAELGIKLPVTFPAPQLHLNCSWISQ